MPAEVLFQGLVLGVGTGVLAAGLVLVHRTLGIINFSQAALGVVGAAMAFELAQYTPVPFGLALLVGVAVSAIVGAVAGLVSLRFGPHNRLFATAVTIVAGTTVAGLADQVRNLPFFPPAAERTTADLALAADAQRLLPFSGYQFDIGDLSFGFGHLLAIQLGVVAVGVVVVCTRFTGLGPILRAVADNPDRAATLGISLPGVTVAVWAAAGALGAVGIISRGVSGNPVEAMVAGTGLDLIVVALVAATLSRWRSVAGALLAGSALGVAQAAWDHRMTAHLQLFEVVLVAVLVLVLVAERPPGRRAADPVSAVDRGWSVRSVATAVPASLRRLPEVRALTVGGAVLIVAAVVAYPYLVSVERIFLGSVIAIQAIAVISVVVLTGWSGQVSLAQYALVAVGAVAGGRLAASPLGFWGAVPVAMAVGAVAAVAVGLPALRVHSRQLLVVTLAVAVMVSQVLFEPRWFGWILPDAVDRPVLFLFDFDRERSMYFLSVAALVVVVAAVVAARRSRFGALVLAARDDPRGLTTFGVSPVRVRLAAFAASGALAGLAGVLLAVQLRGVDRATFGAGESVGVFVAAAFGGIASVGGAVAAAVWFGAVDDLVTGAVLEIFLLAGGTLTLLYLAPGGLAQVAGSARQAWLRTVAIRRRLPAAATAESAGTAGTAGFGPGTPVTGPGTPTRALASELYRWRRTDHRAVPPPAVAGTEP